MRSLLSLATVVLLSAPALAQDDFQVRCEVYRFSSTARAKLLAESASPTAAQVRAAGVLRFEASVPCGRGQLGQVSRARRIPFTTQTTTETATSTSVQFVDVRDSFSCMLRESDGGGIELEVQVLLTDELSKDPATGLPVTGQRQLSTRLSLRDERELLILQGSGSEGEGEALQVVVVTVVRLGR